MSAKGKAARRQAHAPTHIRMTIPAHEPADVRGLRALPRAGPSAAARRLSFAVRRCCAEGDVRVEVLKDRADGRGACIDEVIASTYSLAFSF
jgi:hypothetical protein